MGSGNSRRRQSMEDRESGEGEERNASSNSGDEGRNTAATATGDPDLATILSYLIRSGQVRILASGGLYDEEDSDYYDDEEDCVRPDRPPPTDPHPDTTNLKDSDIQHQILHDTGCNLRSRQMGKTKPLSQLLQQREVGMSGKQHFSPADCCGVNENFLPNKCEVVARYHHKAFCGVYSQEGDIFLSACQDRCLRIYDTTQGRFKPFKCLQARDVGWSVVDTSFSPDGNYLAYSSWSDSIHICSIHGEHETHNSLHLFPDSDHSFCVFSLTFSQDNREIMGGANDGHLYVYDREKNERTLRIDAHEDDVNAVAFADYSSNILCSGGDDGLVKVWDRRTLSESSPEPVGILAGHFDGITYIDARGDGKYILSNSKDQTIKLWDLRKFSPQGAQEATKREVAKQNWDYRWQQVPKRVVKKSRRIHGDSSLMTYRGHCVLNTLVRARFSPQHTTGQRYIISGCATGAVIIYDILTGKVIKRLDGQHRACVRDVSWHPFDNVITSTSWDSTIAQWTYSCKAPLDSDEDSDMSDSDEDGSRGCRKSRRVRDQKRTRNSRSRREFAERVALMD